MKSTKSLTTWLTERTSMTKCPKALISWAILPSMSMMKTEM